MNCSQCGQKLHGEDEIVVFEDSILHVECLSEFVLSNYCSEPQSYLEYLEGEVL